MFGLTGSSWTFQGLKTRAVNDVTSFSVFHSGVRLLKREVYDGYFGINRSTGTMTTRRASQSK